MPTNNKYNAPESPAEEEVTDEDEIELAQDKITDALKDIWAFLPPDQNGEKRSGLINALQTSIDHFAREVGEPCKIYIE